MIEYFNGLSTIEQYLLLGITMIFLHIIADYLVQNDFMATYKQKKNWEQYIKETGKYKHDYIVVLLVHAFSWSFITFLPLLLITEVWIWVPLVILNCFVHASTDDMKCNQLEINLIVDQLLHLLQIVLSLIIVILV